MLAAYEASTPEEIAPAIEAAAKAGSQAMNVLASPLFSFNSGEIVNQLVCYACLPFISGLKSPNKAASWPMVHASRRPIGKWRVS